MKTDMHLHSDFSDGRNTIEEMTRAAIKLGYEQIAFTDHVRRTTDWLDEYVSEIDRIRGKYPAIRIYSGIEAKVLNLDGEVDAHETFFSKVDLVLAAFHRIPNGGNGFFSSEELLNHKDIALDLWYRAFMAVLGNRKIHIMAHPTAILKRYGIDLSLKMRENIAHEAGKCGKAFEINVRYQVPDEQFLALLRNEKVRFSIGSDSHSSLELEQISEDSFWEKHLGDMQKSPNISKDSYYSTSR